MVKVIQLSIDDDLYTKVKAKKGTMTWVQFLKQIAES
jgi:hypothetical protein